jgi:hypothetical protein
MHFTSENEVISAMTDLLARSSIDTLSLEFDEWVGGSRECTRGCGEDL